MQCVLLGVSGAVDGETRWERQCQLCLADSEALKETRIYLTTKKLSEVDSRAGEK